jgi:hypothetical protein
MMRVFGAFVVNRMHNTGKYLQTLHEYASRLQKDASSNDLFVREDGLDSHGIWRIKKGIPQCPPWMKKVELGI